MSLFWRARWLRKAISRRIRADFAETGAGGGVAATSFFEAASTRLAGFAFVTLETMTAFATGLAATIFPFDSTGAGERLLTGDDGLAVNAFTERLETARADETLAFFSPDFTDAERVAFLGESDEAAGLPVFAFSVDSFTEAGFGPVAGFETDGLDTDDFGEAALATAVGFGGADLEAEGFDGTEAFADADVFAAADLATALLAEFALAAFEVCFAPGFDLESDLPVAAFGASFASADIFAFGARVWGADFAAGLASLRETVGFFTFDFCFCRAATSSSLLIPRTSRSPADAAISASSCRERALKSEGVFNAKLPLFTKSLTTKSHESARHCSTYSSARLIRSVCTKSPTETSIVKRKRRTNA